MEKLRDTLLLGALAAASPAFAEEPLVEDIFQPRLGKDLPTFDELTKEAKPVSELSPADLKLPIYTYSWSSDAADTMTEPLNGENIGFRYGGKGSREVSFFLRVDEFHADKSGAERRILYENPNDGSDNCYTAVTFIKLKVKNSVEGEKESIILLNKGGSTDIETVGEQGCEEVLEDVKEEVKKTLNADVLLPASISASVAANSGSVYPYVDPISGKFEPFDYSERNGVSAELRVDWKPLPKLPLSVGPEATLVVGADGTGTAGRVGGHLELEVDRFKVAMAAGERFDSLYGVLNGVPYTGLDVNGRVANIGQSLEARAFLQMNKDFVGNDAFDPNVALGARVEWVIPDVKAAPIAKQEKPVKEAKVKEVKAAEATPAVEATPAPEPVIADAVEPAASEKVKVRLKKEEVALPPLKIISWLKEGNVSDADKAEYTRLTEEMKKLSARNAWPAVEATFDSLEELQKKKKVGLSVKDLKRGAEAARGLGNIKEAFERISAAANQATDDKEALDWVEEVKNNYGSVSITIENKADWTSLTAVNPPFEPDKRAAIAYIQAQLAEKGKFEGYIPVGEYTIGGEKFAVDSLNYGKTLKVTLE